MKIAVLIPCFNEILTIGKVINDFKETLPTAQIYVYDNNSTDNTDKIALEHGAIVRYEYQQGKGNVIRSMFRDIEADVYVLVDGDDTYPASYVEEMIKPIVAGEADMVIGDRLSNGSYTSENKRQFHDFGNRLVRNLINNLFRTSLKDIMSGYRVFNKIFVKNMPISSSGFEIETEINLHALDKNFRIKEIPIQYRDRPNGSVSKLDTVNDGIRVLKTIFRVFKDYKPFEFFLAFSGVFLFLGLLFGVPVINEFIAKRYVFKIPSAILAVGCVLLSMSGFICGLILDTIVRHHREDYEIMIKKAMNNL